VIETSIYTGTPCNQEGVDLPPDSGPLSHISLGQSESDSPWHPFQHRSQYQLADFLFCQNKTPQNQIDDLMDIWASMPEWNGQPPPFANHDDLLRKIDSITGDPIWECLSIHHTDAFVEDESIPAWKRTSYDVWFRAPEALADLQLANPQFKDHIDYSPKQVFGD